MTDTTTYPISVHTALENLLHDLGVHNPITAARQVKTLLNGNPPNRSRGTAASPSATETATDFHRAAIEAMTDAVEADYGFAREEMDDVALQNIRNHAIVAADAAVKVERERIRRSLTLPMLQALRLIPSGRVQQGCVVSDGSVVRERLRAAYHGITADPMTGDAPAASVPLDLVEVAPWLEQCGRCDAGLPRDCTCPAGDARVVIARLVDEVVMLRREVAGEASR